MPALKNMLRLYAITAEQTSLEDIAAALRGGVTMLQLRKKHLGDADLLAFAKEAQALCARCAVPMLLNDRVDIALAVGAAGAHLGPADGDLRAARVLLGPTKILGATARTTKQALAAKSAGADYLGSGAVFGTQTKADATTMSLPLFRKICRRAGVPVVAIGGIDRTNITKLKGCGMAGFAVVSGIFGAEDIAGTARELRGLAEHILAPN